MVSRHYNLRPTLEHPSFPANPPPQLNTDIFSKGAYVRVDPSSTSRGGVGFVTSVHAKERRVDVKYDENFTTLICLRNR